MQSRHVSLIPSSRGESRAVIPGLSSVRPLTRDDRTRPGPPWVLSLFWDSRHGSGGSLWLPHFCPLGRLPHPTVSHRKKPFWSPGNSLFLARAERSDHHLVTPLAVPGPLLATGGINSSDNETNYLHRGLGLQPKVGLWQQLPSAHPCARALGWQKAVFNPSLLSRASPSLVPLCEDLSRTRPRAKHLSFILCAKPPVDALLQG